ncbi:MAG: LysR family transcriptional regulator [Paracoccaceae bacterium]
MSDFNSMKLRSLDLTLLLVFLGLLRHRKAVRVAEDLGLTQPAISHALKRLRAVFGDPLFLRRPQGMEPTSVALALGPQVAAAVDALRAAVAGQGVFVPAEATGEVRISAWDSAQGLLAPGLVARFAAGAPGLRLVFRMLDREAAAEALATGAVDIAVGYFPKPLPQSVAETLYAESYAVVGRPEVLAGPLTLERYLELPHLLVSPRGDSAGIVDTTLAAMGRERRVVAAIPQFMAAMATAAGTGAIATIPARIARRFGPALGLSVAEPPLALRAFRVSAVRHLRNERDGRIGWVVEGMREIAGGVDGGKPPR